MHSQVSPHSAQAVTLTGRFGPVGALRRGGPGPLVLLVPGYTGSKEDFAPLLDPIAEAGFEVVAIDLPGQMDSAGPDTEDDYLPEPLGAFLAELVGKLAASYGGLVCRRAVLAGAPVAGLTLMDSGPADLPASPRRHMLDLGEPVLRENGVPAVHRILEALNGQTPRWQKMSPAQREFLGGRFLRNLAPALLGMGNGLRTEPDLVADLAHALRAGDTPSLVICGEDDDAWPATAQRDMAERLGADFSVVPGAAHSPAIENPADLLATLVPTWRTWVS
jgi:pimeloyl-ACP methyl ester carboxylesterase